MSITRSNAVPFLSDILDFINGAKDIINKYRTVRSYDETRSISDITKLARVEPITVVSKDLINVEYLPDVMQTLLNMFTAYYLQAIAISARIDKAEIIRTLDKLNPDRDSTGFFMSTESMKDYRTLNMESYKYRLPTSFNIGLEDDVSPAVISKDDASQVLNEISNLAIGKVVEVTFDSGNKKDKDDKGSKFSIPVTIRLTPAILSDISIMKILALKTDDNTLEERYHAWRAGRIRFIQDLILCQDLIDAHKKALMNDEAGTYSEIISRVNSAKKYGLLTGNPSLASASNIFIISEEVARELEGKLGGKLSKASIREKVFENTYAMIIAVVDREWQRITFYVRNISSSADYSVKDLKGANKNKGPDITDILKAMMGGSAPTF